MENLEQRALTVFPNPPSVWVRYIDDAIMESPKSWNYGSNHGNGAYRFFPPVS